MIDSYFVNTPNGRKVSIMLAETALPHRVIRGDRGEVDHLSKEFRNINPNARLPAIVDHDPPGGGEPFPVFESGAILIYLAEKSGKFLSKEPRARSTQLQWLMYQMGSVGPFFGQVHHFLRSAKEQVPYAIDRYVKEKDRIYGVLDKRLGEAPHLAGDDYTIADIATYPWVARHEWHKTDLGRFPNVQRWFDAISARPAVRRGMAVPG